MNMQNPPPTQTEGDRARHLSSAVKLFNNPEEALLHSVLFHDNSDPISRRTEEVEAVRKAVEQALKKTDKLSEGCDNDSHKYTLWKAEAQTGSYPFGDPDVERAIMDLIEDLPTSMETSKTSKNVTLVELNKAFSELTKQYESYLMQTRALNYARTIDSIPQNLALAGIVTECARCNETNLNVLSIFRACNHVVCSQCFTNGMEKCVQDDCDTPVSPRVKILYCASCKSTDIDNLSVVPTCGHIICNQCFGKEPEPDICVQHHCNVLVSSAMKKPLGEFDLKNSAITNPSHGPKMAKLIDLLKEIQAKEQKALVFAPTSDAVQRIEAILENITEFKAVVACISDDSKDEDVETWFQDFVINKNDKQKKLMALVLDIASEKASGL